MFFDFGIGSKNELRLQVFNVFGNTFRFMTVGPSDDNILSVAFFQSIPLLIAVNIEVESVEYLKMALYGAACFSCGGGGVAGFSHKDWACAGKLKAVARTSAESNRVLLRIGIFNPLLLDGLGSSTQSEH